VFRKKKEELSLEREEGVGGILNLYVRSERGKGREKITLLFNYLEGGGVCQLPRPSGRGEERERNLSSPFQSLDKGDPYLFSRRGEGGRTSLLLFYVSREREEKGKGSPHWLRLPRHREGRREKGGENDSVLLPFILGVGKKRSGGREGNRRRPALILADPPGTEKRGEGSLNSLLHGEEET